MKHLATPAIFITGVLLAACANTPVDPGSAAASAQPAPAAAATPRPAAAPSSVAVAPVSTDSTPPLDPNSPLARERSVYFEFDDAIVHQDYTPLLQRHARYLVQHPSLGIAVQGNTDERGGSEYNLALGQRRAQAVKTALQLLGVKDSQIEAVSFGEERPAATEHDETAWRQNRRADIVYRR
jgi:peptidoglycan-associated lipoprotein